MAKDKGEKNVVHKFEIFNLGPSTIKNMSFTLSIPTHYTKDKKNKMEIIKKISLSIEAQYKGQKTSWMEIKNENEMRKRSKRSAEKKSKALINEIPINKTIKFTCSDSGINDENCMKSRVNVENFISNNIPLIIYLNFTLNMNDFGEILISFGL